MQNNFCDLPIVAEGHDYGFQFLLIYIILLKLRVQITISKFFV